MRSRFRGSFGLHDDRRVGTKKPKKKKNHSIRFDEVGLIGIEQSEPVFCMIYMIFEFLLVD
jgi:hypothetical protein